MKILYVLKHNPWGIGGGCFASKSYLYAFLHIFKDAQFTIIICSEYQKDIPIDIINKKNICFEYVSPLSRWNSIVEYLHKANHRHRKIVKYLLGRNTFDYCVFDHSSLAGAAIDSLSSITKSIVIHHNCECKYFKDNNSLFRTLLLLPIVRFNERNAFLRCQYNIFLTKEDFESFQSVYGTLNDGYIIGGFESGVINEPSFDYKDDKIVITGSLGNVQNQDGVFYYINSLHKYIPQECNVVITGRNPSSAICIQAKEISNIKLIPSPKDIDSIVDKARLYVCPTRLGSGIKIRIKDALRKGIPVLAHEVSARGYSNFIDAGLMYKFSNEKSFQNGLNALFNFDEEKRKRIFSMFKSEFSFDSGCQKIKDMLFSNT